MKRIWSFLQDTGHLWFLLALIVAGGAGFLSLRKQMIPASYGAHGPYRAAALEELAARPMTIHADAVCLKCHVEVGDERADTLHQAVRCTHCHGLGTKHIAQALRALDSDEVKLEPAQAWDGNFLSHLDLYITKDRAMCLSCHEAVVGMPADFKKINVLRHLEEMGAESPQNREVCFECHGGHNTAP